LNHRRHVTKESIQFSVYNHPLTWTESTLTSALYIT
jgi:hypothetical protein